MAPAPGKMGRLRLGLRLRENAWHGSGQNVPAPDGSGSGSGSGHWGWFLFILACVKRRGHVAISGHPNVIDSNILTTEMSLSVMNKQAGAFEVVLRNPFDDLCKICDL